MKTISDNEFPHIAGVETTSKAWNQLLAAKETCTLDAIVDAQATLHDIKAYEGQLMAEHIAISRRPPQIYRNSVSHILTMDSLWSSVPHFPKAGGHSLSHIGPGKPLTASIQLDHQI